MKADYYGTPTEAKRYIQGWMTPTQRRKRPELGRCRDCRFFDPPRDGRGEFCRPGGFATRPGATCHEFKAQEQKA